MRVRAQSWCTRPFTWSGTSVREASSLVRRGGLLAALAGFALSCTNIFGPEPPEGAVSLHPLPPEYEAWWSLVEECSGLSGSMHKVVWYVVPGSATLPGFSDVAGAYLTGSHRIVLAEHAVQIGATVRHEMLHALLLGGGHPRHAFLERCGGVVTCQTACRTEAGPDLVWDLDHPRATPEELMVSAEVFPSTVSLTADSKGCFSVAVSALSREGTARTVDVRRRVLSISGWGRVAVDPPALADSVVALEGSRPWTWVVDCPAPDLASGQYSVRGELDGLASEPVTLTIVP